MSLRDSRSESWQSILDSWIASAFATPRNDGKVAKTFAKIRTSCGFILFGYFTTLRFAQYDEWVRIRTSCGFIFYFGLL